ncbi:MAG TPA: hypothetical protein HA354_06480 [Candidatus Poseidoniaceae archaeon]|nr:hypothetical protein [Euryarchaeota archaeon]DAC56846.1 MAG TPA: hypothetical protein D7I07_06460 [Candidatus Poseidoniales archaeon]HII38128.1 hypothetical protein [Candidatus Poseidoniaceae archaeon]
MKIMLNASIFEGANVAQIMQKALAQNPNLLRTLLGLSFTLIFLLGYAVYGATISPSYYLYTTESETTINDSAEPVKLYNDDTNQTNWRWTFTADGDNLTWVNVTAGGLSKDAVVKLTNSAGLYSHSKLGDPDAEDFACEDSCYLNKTHELVSEDGGYDAIISMTTTDPGRRDNGTVYASSLGEAETKARTIVEHFHSPAVIIVEVIENGNRSFAPTIALETVNEDFAEISVFSVDAGTEFLWAVAAVVGCFSMILIPSFTVYFAARAKERKNELKLQKAEQAVDDSVANDADAN